MVQAKTEIPHENRNEELDRAGAGLGGDAEQGAADRFELRHEFWPAPTEGWSRRDSRTDRSAGYARG
jgi:hypothetical protein